MTNETKFFKKYAQDLRTFAKAHNLELYIGLGELKAVGMYYIDSNDNDAIAIGESLINRSFKHALIVPLHEMGHFLAEKHGLYESRKNTKEEECLAWVMAATLFDELNWPVTEKHFNSTRKRSLRSYGVKI